MGCNASKDVCQAIDATTEEAMPTKSVRFKPSDLEPVDDPVSPIRENSPVNLRPLLYQTQKQRSMPIVNLHVHESDTDCSVDIEEEDLHEMDQRFEPSLSL